MDAAFLQDQIDATKAMITAYNAAILALIANPTSQYTLDTGQSRQTVTKQDLGDLKESRSSLMNELCTLQARQTGSGTVTGRPAW